MLGFLGLRLTLGTPLVYTSVIGALVGFGMGFTMLTLLVSVQAAVPKEDLGIVTSSVLFARTVAGSVGSAAMGALIGGSLENGSLAAFTDGIGRAFVLALALAVATWCVAFALPRKKTVPSSGALVSTD
ncbi:MAG: MFS transporter [Pleurocapsa sp. SU_196_0]|nr:MFS transporter [Pleurocapsa sp. SU_196_0]